MKLITYMYYPTAVASPIEEYKLSQMLSTNEGTYITNIV